MASIRKRERRDGTIGYYVLFRLEGKQTSDVFDTETEAERFKRLVEQRGPKEARRLSAATADKPKLAPSLTEALKHHLKHLTGAEKGTVAEYQRLAARSWLPALGEIPVDMLTTDMVRAWVGSYRDTPTATGTPRSAKTVANAHALLFAVMGTVVADLGLRSDNPCARVVLPKGTRTEQTFLTEPEFADLLGHVREFYRPFVAFLAGTGLRFGEATALTWNHVDLDGPVPSVRVALAWKRSDVGKIVGQPKSERSRRVVTIGPAMVGLLRAWRQVAPDSELPYVFVSKNGNQIHHQHFHPRIWLPAVRAFAGDVTVTVPATRPGAKPTVRVATVGPGKHPRLHDIRHSHASWMLARGHEMTTVQRRLGHESYSTTDRSYAHVVPDRVAAITFSADAALADAISATNLAAPEAVVGGADVTVNDVVDAEVLDPADDTGRQIGA